MTSMNLQNAPSGTIRAALRYPAFRSLLSALAVSQVGDWLYNLALVVLVYDRTHSPVWAGVTTAARVVPIVALGPLGGVLADRFDRRRLMLTSDLARMGLMVLLAAVAAARLPILLAPVIAAMATAAAAPYLPCVAAVTPRVVNDADLPGANAARSAVTGIGIILGPALGGVLLLIGPPAFAFALNALTFGLSALAVLAIRAPGAFRPARSADRPAGLLREVAQGAAALRAHPEALRLVGADIMCSMLYGTQTVLVLLVSRQIGLGAQGYGYLFAGIGVGRSGGHRAGRPRRSRSSNPRHVLAAALAAAGSADAPARGDPLAGGGGLPDRAHRRRCPARRDPHRDQPAADAGRRRVRPGLRTRAAGLAGRDRRRSLVAPLLAGAFGGSGALIAVGCAVLAYALIILRGNPQTAAAQGLVACGAGWLESATG